MIVAVTGATGIVGRFVVARLMAEGCSVRALARPEADRAGFDRAPHWIEGRLEDAEALAALVAGADGLVHCAFAHVAGRYRGGEGDDPVGFWQRNLLGTVRLLEAAGKAGVPRAVLLSSRAVFARRRAGEHPSTPVDDEHPTWPDTHYGALKVAEEALAAAVSAQGLTTAACLRATGVYGVTWPVDRSKWFELVRTALAGERVASVRRATEVHGDDLAAAVSLLLRAPAEAVVGRAFNCSDLDVDTRELIAGVAAVVGEDLELPPAAPPRLNPMRCDALRALGWRPGGRARLEVSLRALVEAVRREGD